MAKFLDQNDEITESSEQNVQIVNSSDQNVQIADSSDQNVELAESSENIQIGDSSENVQVAKYSDQAQTITELSDNVLNSDEMSTSTIDDNDEQEDSYDFFFVLSQGSTLKNAAAALCDPRFNEQQLAMVQVGKGGFEITVQVIDSKTGKQVFGFLCFKATGLHGFQCNNPLRKMVSVKPLIGVLEASTHHDEDNPVAIFVKQGSNKLSFQWGDNDLGDGPDEPVSIKLHDVKPEYKTFPDVFYGFEAVIPSKMLIDTITELLQMKPECRPTEAFVTLKGATVIMALDEDLILSTENETEKHEVLMDWQYWESLEKSSCLAEKCSMYLVQDPPEHMMFRFKLGELGDLVYLTQAKFVAVSEPPDLDCFRSLLNTRAYQV